MPSPQSVEILVLLDSHDSYVAQAVTNPTLYLNAAEVLSTVFNFLLADPDPDSLNVVWDYFVANQNTSVQDVIALYIALGGADQTKP